MPEKNIEDILNISRQTDLQFAIKAVEEAKARFLNNPSKANSDALDSAIRLRDKLSPGQDKKDDNQQNLPDWKSVLQYAADKGRKLGKSKLFSDIQKGRLKRQQDMSFKISDVDRYLTTVKTAGNAGTFADAAIDRQERKEEQEIRRIKAVADREEFNLKVQQGKYVKKELVYQELAGRAMALSTGLRASFEAQCLELTGIVAGEAKKAAALADALEKILDNALNEYSKEIEFELLIDTEVETEE